MERETTTTTMQDQKSIIIAVGVLAAASVYWFFRKRSNDSSSSGEQNVKSPVNSSMCHINQSILNLNLSFFFQLHCFFETKIMEKCCFLLFSFFLCFLGFGFLLIVWMNESFWIKIIELNDLIGFESKKEKKRKNLKIEQREYGVFLKRMNQCHHQRNEMRERNQSFWLVGQKTKKKIIFYSKKKKTQTLFILVCLEFFEKSLLNHGNLFRICFWNQ